jgi:multidrug transporter EmrE-like cation transporter
MQYVYLIISALLNGLAQILWKQSNIKMDSLYHIFTNYKFIGGLCIYAISIVIWLFVLKNVEVSKAYPILALSYVVVAVWWYFLWENVTAVRIIGICVIILWVFIISKS